MMLTQFLLGSLLAVAEPAAPPTLIETGPPSRAMIEHFRQHEKPERRLHDAHHGGLRDSRTLEH